MAEEQTSTNGYIRWRDLDAARERYDSEIKQLNDSVTERFTRAHDYYSNAVNDQMRVIGSIDARLDDVESTLDKQAGAWTTVKFLIGSNVALTVVGVLTLIAFFR
jgi:hypothetical protein